MRATIEKQFLADAECHELSILRNDGVYRHIRVVFRRSSRVQAFELITWPGHLCITGDMGTYVAKRLYDMFDFFRTDLRATAKEPDKLYINPIYWGEKLVSVDNHAGLTEFSGERFKQAVCDDLIAWLKYHWQDTTKQERRRLWTAVVENVLKIDDDTDTTGYKKQIAAHEFSHYVNDVVGSFQFVDFWEHDCKEYVLPYLWSCYAIVWGIKQFEAITGEQSSSLSVEPQTNQT